MMNPYRTILIDDHPLFSNGLKATLNDSPDFVVVEQVADSRKAQAVCMQHEPDLVLVDFNMPNLDGLAVVRQLRQLPFRCRIVVVSMYADQPEITRFKALNVDGYLAKTVTSEDLLASLNRVMRGERVFVSDTAPASSTLPPDYFWINYQLTQREVDILKLVKAGKSSEQMAAALQISYNTVQTHRRNINRKLPFKTEKEFFDFLDLVGE
jgi:DNA-binding NarL/FixJ family response regulator